jgi:glycosyltransferase involved in cell wall biosynthesis
MSALSMKIFMASLSSSVSSGATTMTSLAGHACVVVPAYEAGTSVARVVREIREALPELGEGAILVVDDGSTDGTAEAARAAGVRVARHDRNRGKGAALRTGMTEADKLGFDVALAVDADGQHPGASSRDVLFGSDDPAALVLGVRDLAGAGAPRANRMSNAISNFFLSRFAGQRLRDTQCGLRRYPIRATLALSTRATGYAFEAEVLLRAIAAGIPIVERDVRVVYPPEHERVTHFDSVRDPVRIILAVLATVREVRHDDSSGKER